MANNLLQSAFTGGELSPSLQARTDFEKFYIGLRECWNAIVQPHGGVTKRPGFIATGSLPGPARLVGFLFSDDQSFALCFGDHWLEVAGKDGFFNESEESGERLHVESPYTYEQAKTFSTVQDGDYIYIACQGQPPRKLVRRSNFEWEFLEIDFVSPIGKPAAVTAARDGTSSTAVTPYTYYISAENADKVEGEATQSNTVTGPASSNWVISDGIKVTWNVMTGATDADTPVKYNIYKASFNGTPLYVTSVNQPTDGSATLTWRDVNNAGSVARGVRTWSNPFPDEDGSGLAYPSVVGLFEQRLVYTGIPADPKSIWFSCIGEYDSFAAGNPYSSADAFKFTLAGDKVSIPRWVMDLRSLVVGSASIEWEVSSSGAGFSLTTAMRKVSSRYGSSGKIPGLAVGSVILHVTRAQNVVRDLQYQFSNDTFGGVDRNILATHLVDNYTIEDWAFQQEPDSIVWAVRNDGVLLGLTFMPEHNIYAWHQHHTDGEFVRVLSIPDRKNDILFAVVRRGADYFLEYLAPRYYSGDYSGHVFSDNAVIVENDEATDTVTGLDYLEGKEVAILADGAVMPRQVVTDGRITIPSKKKRFVIGLPWAMRIVSMPLERANSVTQKKAVSAINGKFLNTLTAKAGIYGRSEDEYSQIKVRSNEPFGSPPALTSGDMRLAAFGIGTEISVAVVSDDPAPCTLLALSVEVG